ncbi:MarR family winged helix-turn-helix transcriptional regulator [Streptacidiphilus sp. P02-A3a]|uniref:MarR family winged helix-turn-helix transcriptional regulator n=1 Tax=Streptacidiphilus sp. P02-A3a TaxID=2704468 RepID=UPI0015FA43DB|nr:MarR family transcriptional regulator [Streptacidiphilus sp. P02-A3a]QMU68778.1 MarR family transcriptional regulator [Streptacidiphilus sp. P02-A3a]
MEQYGEISHMTIRLARAHRVAATRLLQRVGLFPGQELLLMRLWEQDHQPQRDLAAALKLDASTVTRTLQRLEQQGLLSRSPSPADGRSTIVSLTPKGAELRCQVEQLWGELEAITTAGLSERQRNDALRLLRRLERNLIDDDATDRAATTTTTRTRPAPHAAP